MEMFKYGRFGGDMNIRWLCFFMFVLDGVMAQREDTLDG